MGYYSEKQRKGSPSYQRVKTQFLFSQLDFALNIWEISFAFTVKYPTLNF